MRPRPKSPARPNVRVASTLPQGGGTDEVEMDYLLGLWACDDTT